MYNHKKLCPSNCINNNAEKNNNIPAYGFYGSFNFSGYKIPKKAKIENAVGSKVPEAQLNTVNRTPSNYGHRNIQMNDLNTAIEKSELSIMLTLKLLPEN